MKKSALTLLIGIIGIGIWGISTAHDCNLFNEKWLLSREDSVYPTILKDDPILNALPEQAIHRALLNLQAHCCTSNESNKNGTGCKKSSSDRKDRVNYPQSTFLFDHLVDVLMRRLANDKSYAGLPPEKKSEERNNKLDSLMLAAKGILPLEFQNEYDKYRKLQPQYLLSGYNESNSLSYIQTIRSKDNEDRLKNYKDWSIRTAYSNVCSVATYLMMLLAPNNMNNPVQNAREQCTLQTKNMLKKESNYHYNIVVYKADQLQRDTLQLYANNYFGQRVQNLMDKLATLSTEWLGVARQVPKLVPLCTY